jgi:N-acetylglutamate synthase-like GNAT family acetyltransferase
MAVRLRTTFAPGDLGDVVRLHGLLYAKEHGFDHTFEGYVAAGIGEFAARYHEPGEHGCLWLAELDGQLVGSVAIVIPAPEVGQLRWFLVHPDARGRGLGRQLLEEALAFARKQGLQSVFLWTVRGLDAAARLYRACGFQLTAERPARQWGADHVNQRYDLPARNTQPTLPGPVAPPGDNGTAAR